MIYDKPTALSYAALTPCTHSSTFWVWNNIIVLFSVIENCKSAENGQAHKSTVALAAIQEKQIWTQHSPYSPDVTPSDYYLLTKMKEELSGCHLTAVSQFAEVPRCQSISSTAAGLKKCARF